MIDQKRERDGVRYADAYRLASEAEQTAADLRDGLVDPEGAIRRLAALVAPPHASTARERFRLYTPAELAQLPAPAWLIDGILPEGGLAMIVAEKESYKTFLALDWAAHIDTGHAWLGRTVKAGAVVYVYGEGRAGIGPRLDAWMQFHHELPSILFLPSTMRLNDREDAPALLAAIRERLGDERPVLIVLDTLNRTFVGNENSTEDMTAYRAACDTLREATGACVLVLHHKGRGEADRGRGSGVLEDSADTVIFVSRDAERMTLECTKQRDAGHFTPIALEAVSVGPSLVLRAGGQSTGTLAGNRLNILRVLHDESSGAGGMTHKAWKDATSLAASSFNKALEWLRDNGFVRKAGGKWRLTPGGHLSLDAVQFSRSTSSPPSHGGPNGRLVHHHPGSYKSPEGDHDRVDRQNGHQNGRGAAAPDPGGEAWEPDETQADVLEF